MSRIQQQEELDYNTTDEYINVLRAEAFDPYEQEQAYYCEEHDYEDYSDACPFGPHAPVRVTFLLDAPDLPF